jgi:DNA polymerase (family 10)
MEKEVLKHRWWDAMQIAIPLVERLRLLPEVEKIEIAGSLRRGSELVKDINLIAAAENALPILKWFTTQPDLVKVLSLTQNTARAVISDHLEVEIRIVSPKEFAYEFIYLTGSKEHNETLQRLPQKAKPSRSKTEASIYKSFGMQFIPPELRENRGEIEASIKNEIPKLIDYKDIHGTFHVHTNASDGKDSLRMMIQAAEDLGWDYIGITDHSKSCTKGNGLSEERLLAQVEEIRAINQSKKYKVHVFSGVECDILLDGSLDFSTDILKQLDFVVVSIHSSLNLAEEAMTKRMIRAIENPYTTIFGHISGRILLRQQPYLFNYQKVIDACIANQKIVELNANPKRIDMDWRYWHEASQNGLLCSINPDAHEARALSFVEMGVKFAKKGWLEKKSVINTYSLAKIKKILYTAKLCQ